MSNFQHGSEFPVDRRTETVQTQQPGYAATEQVITDAAVERRLGMNKVTGTLLTILGVLQILLGLRFVLRLMAANPASGFADFIYSASALFLTPFASLVRNPAAQGMVLELTTLIAMAIYALGFWIVLQIIPLVLDRTSARSVSRTVREGTPRPPERIRSERTHHTTGV